MLKIVFVPFNGNVCSGVEILWHFFCVWNCFHWYSMYTYVTYFMIWSLCVDLKIHLSKICQNVSHREKQTQKSIIQGAIQIVQTQKNEYMCVCEKRTDA